MYIYLLKMYHFVSRQKPNPLIGMYNSNMKRSHVPCIYPDDSVPEPWLILRSQAKKERILVIQLLRKGFDAWLPEVKHWRFRVGKRENITKVLIPGYVFARTKEAISVDKFNLPGSKGLLIQDGKPALLSHDDAMNLNRLCSLDLAPEITTNLSCGQQITIDSGPLKGISGKVVRTEGKQYLIIESGIKGILLKVNLEQNAVIGGKTPLKNFVN